MKIIKIVLYIVVLGFVSSLFIACSVVANKEIEEQSKPIQDDGKTEEPKSPIQNENNAVVLTSENIDQYSHVETTTSTSGGEVKKLIINEGVERIEDEVFYFKFFSEVKLPSSLTHIGKSSFSGCGLTSLEIPSTVVSIGDSAFSLNKLTNIEIPKAVTSIGSGAFSFNELSSVSIHNNSPAIDIGIQAFSTNKITEVKMSSGVYDKYKGITFLLFTFSGQYKIHSITSDTSVFEEGVTINETNKLNYSEITTGSETRLSITEGVTNVGQTTFASKGLAAINFPSSLVAIETNAFAFNSLTDITMPVLLKLIGNGTFKNNKLTNVVLSDSLLIIGKDAFYENQLKTITIPKSVIHIEAGAFIKNHNLATVTMSSKLWNDLKANRIIIFGEQVETYKDYEGNNLVF